MSKRKLRKLSEKKTESKPEAPATPIADTSSRYISKAEAASAARVKFTWQPFAILCGIIILAVVICFSDTIGFGMVFNDKSTFARLGISNPQTYFADLWVQAFTQPLMQPWLRASFALDFSNYSTAFGWYHLVNVFLHLSSCLALFCLVLRLCWRLRNDEVTSSDPWKVAGVAALLFACHPLVVQSASYITSRYSPLGACNFLIALNFFLVGLCGRSGTARGWGYGLTFVAAFMSLVSNEVSLALPLTMLAVFFIAKPRDTTWSEWAIEHPFVTGVLVILSMTTPFLYFAGFQPGYAADWYGTQTLNTAAYTATQAKAFFTYYLRCFFVPLGLSIDPPYSLATGWSDPLALVGAVAGVGLIAGLRLLKSPIVYLGLALLLAGFLPHAFIVQQESVADPIFYLSLAGLCVVAAFAVTESVGGNYRQFASKVGPVLVVLGVLSIVRNLDWSADDKLFASTLKTNESSVIALTWTGDAALVKRDYAKALSFADQALAVNPTASLAALVKASALTGLARYADADAAYRTADGLATKQHLPMEGSIKLSWAENALRLGKATEAEQLVYKALARDPQNQRALYVAGLVEFNRSNYEKAYLYLRKAAEAGIADALPPLTDCAIRNKYYEQSLKIAEAAVRANDTPEAQLAMGEALFANAKYAEAQVSLKKVLKEMPKNATALAFLSLSYQNSNNPGVAESYRRDALKLDPAIFSKIPLPAAKPAPAAGGAEKVKDDKAKVEKQTAAAKSKPVSKPQSGKQGSSHRRRRH